MNAKLLLSTSLAALAAIAQAQDSQPKSGVTVSATTRTEWNTNPAYWERILIPKTDSPELRIGKSDWVVKGPLLEGIRRPRSTGERRPSERTAGRRLLSLPIVRLLVPQPIAAPPGGGRYLLWGESDRPWLALAEGTPAGTTANTLNHEARTSLISILR